MSWQFAKELVFPGDCISKTILAVPISQISQSQWLVRSNVMDWLDISILLSARISSSRQCTWPNGQCQILAPRTPPSALHLISLLAWHLRSSASSPIPGWRLTFAFISLSANLREDILSSFHIEGPERHVPRDGGVLLHVAEKVSFSLLSRRQNGRSPTLTLKPCKPEQGDTLSAPSKEPAR